jgi:hypothetical protein
MTRGLSNNQWIGGIGLTPPQNISSAKIRWNISRSIFWDQDGILHIKYLPKGQIINAEYYLSLLVQLQDIVKEKRRGNITKVFLFLHNAPAYRALATQKKVAYLGFHCLDHPPYCPDLAPSDHHLFPGLKKNNWKVAILRPTRKSLLSQRPGWTDKFLIFC